MKMRGGKGKDDVRPDDEEDESGREIDQARPKNNNNTPVGGFQRS
jgi:hypothetical protein